MYWSVRREAVGEPIDLSRAAGRRRRDSLLGFLISTIRLPAKMRAASALDPMQQHNVIAQPYDMAAGLMMLTTLVVGVFYCLDALYGERRDRSILFWKSLPVSDLTTVLSKASIPVVILPLLTFAITVGDAVDHAAAEQRSVAGERSECDDAMDPCVAVPVAG